MLGQLLRDAPGQVLEPSEVVWEDVEDAVVAVFEVDGEPRGRVRLLVHERLGVAQELFDRALVARMRAEGEEQPLRVRLAGRARGQLIGEHVELLYARRRGEKLFG